MREASHFTDENTVPAEELNHMLKHKQGGWDMDLMSTLNPSIMIASHHEYLLGALLRTLHTGYLSLSTGTVQ